MARKDRFVVHARQTGDQVRKSTRPACAQTPPVDWQQKLAVFIKIFCSLSILIKLLIVVLALPIQAALHFMFQAMRNTIGASAIVRNPPATVAIAGSRY